MEPKQWFLVPRRESPRLQRSAHVTQPLVEQLKQSLVERTKQARVEGATTTPRSAGIKKNWFEHPRRTS
jgi:hypothetical protein